MRFATSKSTCACTRRSVKPRQRRTLAVRISASTEMGDRHHSKAQEWIAWFDTTRLLEPLGYVPSAEFPAQYARTRLGVRRVGTQATESPEEWGDSVQRTEVTPLHSIKSC